MNKNDLVAKIASSANLTKKDAAAALEAFIDAIGGELKGGGEARIVGFGTFHVTKRAATTGRNPRTGEAMQIKASNLPKFRAGKFLKDAVN